MINIGNSLKNTQAENYQNHIQKEIILYSIEKRTGLFYLFIVYCSYLYEI